MPIPIILWSLALVLFLFFFCVAHWAYTRTYVCLCWALCCSHNSAEQLFWIGMNCNECKPIQTKPIQTKPNQANKQTSATIIVWLNAHIWLAETEKSQSNSWIALTLCAITITTLQCDHQIKTCPKHIRQRERKKLSVDRNAMIKQFNLLNSVSKSLSWGRHCVHYANTRTLAHTDT